MSRADRKKNYGYIVDPCPFCGGEAVLVQTDPNFKFHDEEYGFVRCTKCEVEQAWSEPFEKAVERWNTRV